MVISGAGDGSRVRNECCLTMTCMRDRADDCSPRIATVPETVPEEPSSGAGTAGLDLRIFGTLGADPAFVVPEIGGSHAGDLLERLVER